MLLLLWEGIFTALSFGSGISSTITAALNGETGRVLNSPFWSAVWNKTLATVVYLILILLVGIYQGGFLWTKGVKKACRVVAKDYKQCVWLFGCIPECLYLLFSIWLPSIVGTGSFFVASILGQVILSAVIDLTGILWNVKKDLFLVTWIGLFIVLGGAITFQGSDMVDEFGSDIGYMMLAIFAGALKVTSTCFNRKIHYYVDNYFVSSFYMTFTSWMVLVAPAFATESAPTFYNFNASNWWLNLVCLLSVFSITVGAFAPGKLGYSKHYGLAITGQIVGSLVVDGTGFLQPEKLEVTWLMITGSLLTIGGVVLMQLGDFFQAPKKSLPPKPAMLKDRSSSTHSWSEKGSKEEEEDQTEKATVEGMTYPSDQQTNDQQTDFDI